MSGLPPLPALTGQERVERVLVRQLQRSFIASLSESRNVGKAGSGTMDWPGSPQRRKAMHLTRYYDDLSRRYQTSMSGFRDGRDNNDDEAALYAQIAAYHHSLPCPKTNSKKSKLLIADGPLAKSKRDAQIRTALMKRDFRTSFASLADGVAGGSLLRERDPLSQKKQWTKLKTAQKIRSSMLLRPDAPKK